MDFLKNCRSRIKRWAGETRVFHAWVRLGTKLLCQYAGLCVAGAARAGGTFVRPETLRRVPPSSAVKRQSLAAKRRPPKAANPSAAGENFLMYPLLFSFWALYPFCAVGRVWSIVQVTHMPIPRARQSHRRMLRISWTLQA